MNTVLAQFERLYQTKLSISNDYQESMPFAYEFKHNAFSYCISSALKLSELQVSTMVMALKLSLDVQNQYTLEYCFEKALSQVISFDETHQLNNFFNAQNQPYTLFIIEGKVDVATLTFIYQLKEEQLLLILKDECIVGLVQSNDARLALLQIVEMIESELMLKVKVLASHPFVDTNKIEEAYQEVILTSRMAKLYYDHKKIVMTSDLGLALLLKTMDQDTIKSIIEDLLKGKTTLEFSEEDLRTIHSFFENHLNIAETARQLYVHRNTLIYRLDKYMSLTGLDIRRFDEAVLLKMCIMLLQLNNR